MQVRQTHYTVLALLELEAKQNAADFAVMNDIKPVQNGNILH